MKTINSNKKYIVEFRNALGKYRVIGYVDNFDEFWEIISKFIDERNYKSYYQKYWIVGNKIKVDVGSHSEFFYVSRADGSEIKLEDLHKNPFREGVHYE